MELDEKWIRAHLPEDCKDEPIDWFSGLYLDGLKVMSEGERGDPDKVRYEAKDEEDLKWWQLNVICGFVGKADKSKTWRWYRDVAKHGFIEISHSREYTSDLDKSDAVKPDNIVQVVD